MENPAPAQPQPPPAAAAGGDEEPEELVELQLEEEARLEALFAEMRRDKGLDDEETLDVFFKLFNMWIQLYRLNKCLEVLEEVVPICRRRGERLHIQGVQALAFTLWKQSKFKDAMELFIEIEGLAGPSAALCENMGHTYSSMGDFPEAAKSFQRALACLDIDEKMGKKNGNRGGVLLGLGLIEDRLGHLEKALEFVREAQAVFRERAEGKPASLIAKAGMSIAKILLKLAAIEKDEEKKVAMEEEAVVREKENVQLFEITCGADSPLTASALRGLAEALVRRGQLTEAQVSFARSYLLEAQKDAFDLLAIMEVHNSLVDSHLAAVRAGAPLDRGAFRQYLPTIEVALARVRKLKQDGNAGAYYKVAGELRAFAEAYEGASALLGEAAELFATEEPDLVAGLMASCLDLKSFCERQQAAAAAPPAPGDVSAAAA